MQSELQLFLDTGKPLSGKPQLQTIRWWVVNNAALDVDNLHIECTAVSPGISFPGYPPLNRKLGPGNFAPLQPSFKIEENGEYSFRAHLSGKFGGVCKSFVTDDILIKLGQGKCVINIAYQGIIDGIDTEGDVHLKVGHASADQQGVGGEVDIENIQTHGGDVYIDAASAAAVKNLKIRPEWHRPAEFNPENQCEQPLYPCDTLQGVHPVDFKLLDKTWKGKTFELDFVDERGHVWETPPAVEDVYRLRIRSREDGYLTLIGQGTSKAFYALVPNNTRPAESFFLKAGQTYYFPSASLISFAKQFDEEGNAADMFRFGDAGVESILATLTATPIHGQNSIFFNNTVSDLEEKFVSGLLETISKQADAALAVTRVDVQKKSFSWT